MTTKRFVFWMAVFVTMILSLSQTSPAAAQEPTPAVDHCVSCHEQQYYLYDEGHLFCLCGEPMHCVYCHEGRPDSPLKDVAHEGLVLYPAGNQAERCNKCHGDEYEDHLAEFASMAHDISTPKVNAAISPSEVTAGTSVVNSGMLPYLERLESWRLVGLGFVGIAMIALVFLGYRCWKADCLAKLKTK